MQSNSYKLKYFKYKTKYLNLLREMDNKKGGEGGISILDSAKKEKSLIKGEKKPETTAGVTSAINGRLGIAKDIVEGTAGKGELCNPDFPCSEGEICVGGNCEIEPPVTLVKREKTEAEKRYDSQINALEQYENSK